VLSRTLGKQEDGKRLGATHYFATQDEATFAENASTFDLIINTVSADLPMDSYMALLRPLGALVNVGLPTKPYQIAPSSVVGGSRALAGSAIGGIAQTQEMLDFCAERGVASDIEIIPIQQINQAYDRLLKGDVRYRFVIDNTSLQQEAPAA
jgi:alcohol dehydrogenase (NADP+)